MAQAIVIADEQGEAPEPSRSGAATVWGAVFTACVVVLAVVTVVVASSPGGDLFQTVVVGLAWLGLGVVWAAWFLLELVRAVRRRSFDRRRWMWLAVSALVVAVTAGNIVNATPEKVRFEVVKSDMTAYAKTVAPTTLGVDEDAVLDVQAASGDRCFARMCFDRVENIGGTVYFSQNAGVFDLAGFAYSPAGAPDPDEQVVGYSWQFEPLGDNWYRFYANE